MSPKQEWSGNVESTSVAVGLKTRVGSDTTSTGAMAMVFYTKDGDDAIQPSSSMDRSPHVNKDDLRGLPPPYKSPPRSTTQDDTTTSTMAEADSSGPVNQTLRDTQSELVNRRSTTTTTMIENVQPKPAAPAAARRSRPVVAASTRTAAVIYADTISGSEDDVSTDESAGTDEIFPASINMTAKTTIPVRRRSVLKAPKPPREEDTPPPDITIKPHFLAFMETRTSSVVAPSSDSWDGGGGYLFSRSTVQSPNQLPLDLEPGDTGSSIIYVGRRRRPSAEGVRPVIPSTASFSGRATAPTPTPSSRREEHQTKRQVGRNFDDHVSPPPLLKVTGGGGIPFSARPPLWGTTGKNGGGGVMTPRSAAIAVSTYMAKVTGSGGDGAVDASNPTGAFAGGAMKVAAVESRHIRSASDTVTTATAPSHDGYASTFTSDGRPQDVRIKSGNVPGNAPDELGATANMSATLQKQERCAEQMDRDSDEETARSSSQEISPLEWPVALVDGNAAARRGNDENSPTVAKHILLQQRKAATARKHDGRSGPDAAAGGGSIGHRALVRITPTRSRRALGKGVAGGLDSSTDIKDGGDGVKGSAMSVTEFADKVAVLAADVVAVLGMHRKLSNSSNSSSGSCGVESRGGRRGGVGSPLATARVNVQRKTAGGGR